MRSLLAGVFALLSLTAFSQAFTTVSKPEDAGMSSARLSKIDKMIEEHIANGWIPGAVVLIARNGKIVYHKAYGYSDVESKTAMKKDNIFRIASQSKAITSLAVMTLWEDGRFGLDDPISRYIPEFKSQRVMQSMNWADTTYTTIPARSEITIRQLLTHTSGLDYAGIGSQEFKAIYAKAGVPSGIGNDNMVLAEKMKILGGLPLKHHPGEAYTYGLNNDVLGYLVEVLSGMSFDQYLKTKIFTPLGMNDTYFYLPKEKRSRLVGLYGTSKGSLAKVTDKIFDNVDPVYPTLEGKYYSGGAGLSGTAEDYAKFLQMYLNNGQFNGTKLLSRKTIELVLTPQLQAPLTNQVGLGFGLETEKNDYSSVYSLGSFSWGGAFATQYWADPKEKLVGLIYLNLYGGPNKGTADKFKVLTYQAIID
ncbi:MAG TPA: serine hydrolase domain-containing protein [Cyclobacteriaceae bacterium]|nr:serine hydrolase domain-containing protein [Cyclobacteriaceae bacterium]